MICGLVEFSLNWFMLCIDNYMVASRQVTQRVETIDRPNKMSLVDFSTSAALRETKSQRVNTS